ncbi:MAG: class I SAM-dependent methyltransferase [Anaerolineales bacterium]
MIREWLAHPLTRGLDLDDPRTTELRREIILSKPFLRRVYQTWFDHLKKWVNPANHRIVEIGSGASLSTQFFPDLITSDMFQLPWLSLVMNGLHLPFGPQSLDAIIMVNTFHHIPDPAGFMHEANRCLRPGGSVCMIEPWVTRWSRWVYTRLHHEPFDPGVESWLLPDTGPLSSANGALPWIVFERDKRTLARKFEGWRAPEIRPIMPFSYLVSGGVSMRSLMPGWTYPLWASLEGLLQPFMNTLAMFAAIRLEKSR